MASNDAEVSDELLYRRLLDGDLGAFDVLYARHAPSVFGFARRQLGDRSAAEDVLHEAFLTVLRERDPRRVARSFRAWLFQVTRNLCLNRHRATKRASAAEAELAHAPAVAEAADRLFEASEARAALSAAVHRLPPALAELYQLRTSGLSYDEMADALALPLGTVKSRMHELVQRLKEEIEPWAAD
ncbi:sigma-70 family RNA polymerase sigma factor [Myxococcota bacterium]|nr:sigma-70 family RNA polymerase sigma factor [Myxococcota bacterium]